MDELNEKTEYKDICEVITEDEELEKQLDNEKWESKYKDDNVHDLIKELHDRISAIESELKKIRGDKDKFDRKKYNLKMYQTRIESLKMITCECGKKFREDRKIFHMTTNYHKKRMEAKELDKKPDPNNVDFE